MEQLRLSQALAMFRQGNRAAPEGPYWDAVIEKVSATLTAKGSAHDATPRLPDSASLAEMHPVARRLAVRELLLWADSHGALPITVHLLLQVPPEGWTRI
jgi:hypothetical protein